MKNDIEISRIQAMQFLLNRIDEIIVCIKSGLAHMTLVYIHELNGCFFVYRSLGILKDGILQDLFIQIADEFSPLDTDINKLKGLYKEISFLIKHCEVA